MRNDATGSHEVSILSKANYFGVYEKKKII